MTETPIAQFDRATAVAEKVIAAIRPDQLDDPTPCSEWSVRQLLNHMVGGNLAFVGIVTGGPAPDRERDHLGGDPLAAFQQTAGALREALAAEGALERMYQLPIGQGPGTMLVNMRGIETMLHAWDLAKATGQSTELDPELAEAGLRSLRTALPADRSNAPFDPEQPAPAGASAADRLAAFAGRKVA